jgi:hypothetical protein
LRIETTQTAFPVYPEDRIRQAPIRNIESRLPQARVAQGRSELYRIQLQETLITHGPITAIVGFLLSSKYDSRKESYDERRDQSNMANYMFGQRAT